MLAAINSGNAKALAAAVCDLMALGDSDESSDSASPHSYDAQNEKAAQEQE